MEMKSPLTENVTVRRNPHRKARTATAATICLQKPTGPSSSTPLEVSSFPIDEILAIDVPKLNPNPNPKPDEALENLRVFLRIRPILHSKNQNPKPRSKNAWPQNPAKKIAATREKIVVKKNSEDACITVNDSHSVTLSPPLALQESKRIKSEFYEGFSHVFATDSSQEQVFEKMVFPLVEDFLKGKSGMLAALGPSGSGKTHTVFGSPRDPGIVPRTLHRIFEADLDSASKSQRSFSISIFEIHTERGKGEKIFDLCSDGAELIMRQSIIRGLQEVIVSDAKEAESLIAKAMLMRLTASTNSNTQSSRSQCIINIRGAATDSDEEPNNAVLSIIDLAGAEREKKTGNQGARLLESNFINNTSMVFGSCLRSLLEHQKNPKKPLQKHFQNSLLTRYLRDYMEGKRRMTLILTVKSEEENYLDTTHLLRQASPYMSIRCNTVEEQSSINFNKRQPQAISRKEKPKRPKISACESDVSEIAEKKICEDELCPPVQEVSKEASSVELKKRDRSYQILQHFSKALWTVLKQHGEQLKVAEGEVKRLAENLELEKTKNVELEKKLESLKLGCTCSQPKSTYVPLSEEDTSKRGVELIGLSSTNLDKSNVDLSSLPACSGAPPTAKISDSSQIQDQVISSQTNLELHSSNISESVDYVASEKRSSTAEPSTNLLSQVRSLDVKVVDPTLHVKISQQKSQIDVITSGCTLNLKDVDDSGCFETNDVSVAVTDHYESSSQAKPENLVDEKKQESLNLPKSERSVVPSEDGVNKGDKSALRVKKSKKLLEPSISTEDIDPNADRENKSVVKPKRRLLPASSSLLRDFNALDFVDVNEKPRGSRGGKKVTSDEKYRTQGNTALLRLLQSNHRA